MDPERLRDRDLDLDQLRDELHALVRTEIQNSMAEHEKRDHERYDTLRDGQVKLQRTVDDMNGKVGRINAEIGYGLPEPDERNGRPTIRDRLHSIEDAKHAATAAGAALGLLFGRITRWFVVVGIVVAAVTSLLRLMGVGG